MSHQSAWVIKGHGSPKGMRHQRAWVTKGHECTKLESPKGMSHQSACVTKLNEIEVIIIPPFDTKAAEYFCSVFFLQTHFDFLTSHFWRSFLYNSKGNVVQLNFEKIFHLWSFFVRLWGIHDCHLSQFETINAQYILRYKRVNGDLIRHRNRSKLVEGCLFSIIVLLQGVKSILLYLIWRVAGLIIAKTANCVYPGPLCTFVYPGLS